LLRTGGGRLNQKKFKNQLKRGVDSIIRNDPKEKQKGRQRNGLLFSVLKRTGKNPFGHSERGGGIEGGRGLVRRAKKRSTEKSEKASPWDLRERQGKKPKNGVGKKKSWMRGIGKTISSATAQNGDGK